MDRTSIGGALRTYNMKRTTFVRMSQSKVSHRNLRQQNETTFDRRSQHR